MGAGNLATHLSQALQQASHRVLQVFSRTEESASALADVLDCPFTTEVTEVLPAAEVYFFCVSDAVLQDLASRLYAHLRKVALVGSPCRGAGALFLHTAGSMPLDVLPTLRRGVFYPMQTFSKSRPVDFRQVPIFLESQTDTGRQAAGNQPERGGGDIQRNNEDIGIYKPDQYADDAVPQCQVDFIVPHRFPIVFAEEAAILEGLPEGVQKLAHIAEHEEQSR